MNEPQTLNDLTSDQWEAYKEACRKPHSCLSEMVEKWEKYCKSGEFDKNGRDKWGNYARIEGMFTWLSQQEKK